MTKRIELLDTVRGLAVVMMTVYHIFFDMAAFEYISYDDLSLPWIKIFQFSGWMFIFISGACCNFSRSNFSRGVKIFAIAMVVYFVSLLVDMPIRFGVLHFLGSAMMLYGLFGKYMENIDGKFGIGFCVVMFAALKYITDNVIVASRLLFPFGFVYDGFYSADYYPIFPWIFLFTAGVFVGRYMKRGKVSEKIKSAKVPFLSWLGQRSLIIYILHQPIIYGAFLLIAKI